MNGEQKQRMQSLLKKSGILLAAGIGYVIFTKLTNWGIPCLFHLLTGKLCPGCGISRMFLALLRGDIITAARYNLLVLCLLPAFLFLTIRKSLTYIKNGSCTQSLGESIFYIVAFVLVILFTVLRNTNLIPFLQMP